MSGRIRASSSSPESFETLPSKIRKDDLLSIDAEMKLKLGSLRELSLPSERTQIEVDSDLSSSCVGPTSNSRSSEDTVISPHEEVIAIDTECSSGGGSPGSVDSHSMGSMKEQRIRSRSVFFTSFLN